MSLDCLPKLIFRTSLSDSLKNLENLSRNDENIAHFVLRLAAKIYIVLMDTKHQHSS